MSLALKTAVALAVLLLNAAAVYAVTSGFRAFTSIGAARLTLESLPHALPEIRFVDQDGREFTLAQLGQRRVLVSFVLADCTRACLLTNARFKQIQEALLEKVGEDPRQPRPMLLSVGLDLARDRPERLREIAAVYGADPRYWRLVVPEGNAAFRDLRKGFGLWVARRSDGEYAHDSSIAVINGQGELERLVPPETSVSDLLVLAGHASRS